MTERSQSRGRDMTSSGRGGMGNIHSTPSADRPEDGPDDFSATRGREFVVNSEKVFSTGRGGAGNIRSPSRDVSTSHTTQEEINAERNLSRHSEREVVSTGRGGMGNMSRSRSRARNEQDTEHQKGHGVSNLLHKVLHPHEGHTGHGNEKDVKEDVPVDGDSK